MRVMKDSGIEWLGQVPECWELRRLQYILRERNEKNIPVKTSEILSLTASQGVIPHAEKEGGGNKPKEDLSAYKLAYPDDIVMNSMNVLSGAVGLSKYYGCVSPVYYMLYSDDESIDIRFYNYMFKTKAFQRSLMGLGNGILIKESDNGTLNTIRMRIPMEKLSKLNLVVPSIVEQRKIVDFLEGKIPELEDIILRTKESIEEYKRYRETVILEIVTKGLNPSVPMVKVELDFANEIPKHWNRIKISRLYSMHSGKNIIAENFVDDGIFKVYGGNGFRGYYNEYNTDGEHLLVGRQGALCGNIHLVNEKLWATDHALVCDENTELTYNKYYFYCFTAMNFNQYSRSAAQPGISSGQIGLLYTCMPPVEEQIEIAEYLDEKCAEIDTLIAKKEAFVEELEAYK